MLLLIDIGNTKTKWMLRDQRKIYQEDSFLTEDIDLEWFTRPFDPSNTLRRCEKQEHLVDINFAWLDEIALPPTNSTEPVAGPR